MRAESCGRETAAALVGGLCSALRKLQGASFDTLSYLLDIAALEAERLAQPEIETKTAP